MNLLLANWRNRTPACVIQFESKDLRTGITKDGGQEKVEVPAQQRANVLFLSLFALSIQALKMIGSRSPMLGELISLGNSLTGTSRNNVLPTFWVPFPSVRLTHKISHHCILLLCAFIVIIFYLYSSLLFFYSTSQYC